MSSRLDFIKSTRAYKDAMTIHVVLEDPPGSPVMQDPESHAIADYHTLAVRRATANLHNNVVSLSHTMIAEEIREHIAEAGLADFTTASMQATVLLHCIQTLCIDASAQDQRTIDLAANYCGVYLPEHLQSVTPAGVVTDMRTKIAKGLIALLRNPLSIARWVKSGEKFLADDLLGSPDFHQMVLKWLEDDTVQTHLTEDEREWHSRVIEVPIATMFGGVAQSVARRWLTGLEGGGSNADLYGFLKTYQVCFV